MPSPVSVEVIVPPAVPAMAAATTDAVVAAVGQLTAEAQAEAQLQSPTLTGGLRGAIGATVAATAASTVGIVAAVAPYSRYVEEGTGPQHVPGSRDTYTPPFSRIASWATARGLSPGAVWASIRRKGTRAHAFMRPAAQKVLPQVGARIAAAIAAVLGRG